MSKLIELASGQLSNSDRLVIVLSQPDDMPQSVIIHWPSAPTVVAADRFTAAGDAAVKIFAAAVVNLAQSRRGY